MARSEFRLLSLTTSGGDDIPLLAGSLVLLVGPNNSGKSAALREIADWFAPDQEQPKRLVLKSVQFTDMQTSQLLDEMGDVYPIIPLPNGNVLIRFDGRNTHQMSRGGPLSHMYQIFRRALIQRLDTETRLTYANPAPRLDLFGDDAPSAGIHWLQKNEVIYQKVSGIVRAAFGSDLIINWGGGSTIGFHVGDAPAFNKENQDRVSADYLKSLNELPRLEQMGDGIRSFVATVVAAHVGRQPVLLIDEPDAFLHPPQAARIGVVL